MPNYVHICTEPEMESGYSPQPLSTLVLEIGFLSQLELISFARLAGQQIPVILLSPSSNPGYWDYGCASLLLPFYMGAWGSTPGALVA